MIKEEDDVKDDSADKWAGDGHVSVLVSVDRLVVHWQVDGHVSAMKNKLVFRHKTSLSRHILTC